MFNWFTKLFKKEEIKKETIKVKDINNVSIKIAYVPRTKKFIPNIDKK